MSWSAVELCAGTIGVEHFSRRFTRSHAARMLTNFPSAARERFWTEPISDRTHENTRNGPRRASWGDFANALLNATNIRWEFSFIFILFFLATVYCLICWILACIRFFHAFVRRNCLPPELSNCWDENHSVDVWLKHTRNIYSKGFFPECQASAWLATSQIAVYIDKLRANHVQISHEALSEISKINRALISP